MADGFDARASSGLFVIINDIIPHSEFGKDKNFGYSGACTAKSRMKNKPWVKFAYLFFGYTVHFITVFFMYLHAFGLILKAMTKAKRSETRYNLQTFGLKGELILFPDPRIIPVSLDDISPGGAAITILSEIDGERQMELDSFVKAAKEGNRIPVQFIFNKVKIPVCLLNRIGPKSYGIGVSDNEKLSILAEKGKQFFQELCRVAATKGVGESDFVDHLILGREFLPEDIRYYVEGRMFDALFVPILLNELAAMFPELAGKVVSREESQKVADIFQKAMAEMKKDVPLLVGAELDSLRKQGKRLSHDGMLPLAIHALCHGGGFFPDESARKHFESRLNGQYLKKRMPPDFQDLAPGHPFIDMIAQRFDVFTHKIFFIQELGSHVCDYYLGRHISPSSEMAAVFGREERLVKTTLLRWVQNELNEAATSRQKGSVGKIEGLFKQAMYEYMLRRKINNISPEEIFELFNGKISEEFRDVREKFLSSVCKMIDPAVQERFALYKADTHEERTKIERQKEDALNIRNLTPLELTRRFLWPKIVEMGVLIPFQREMARTWISGAAYLNFAELGGVVIFTRPSYDEFLAKARPIALRGEILEDYFDEIDLQKIYQRTVEVGGKKRKDVFGLHVDLLQPYTTRDLVLEKVVNNPEWSRYYILKKPKTSFSKVFGPNAPGMFAFIEEHMLTPTTAGLYI